MRGTNSGSGVGCPDGKCPKNADTELYSRTSVFGSVAQAVAQWVGRLALMKPQGPRVSTRVFEWGKGQERQEPKDTKSCLGELVRPPVHYNKIFGVINLSHKPLLALIFILAKINRIF